MTQENTTSTPAKKLLDQVREKIRFKHYSISTEKTYISWIKHYIVFNGKRHLVDMRTVQVETLLIDLNDESLFFRAIENHALSTRFSSFICLDYASNRY